MDVQSRARVVRTERYLRDVSGALEQAFRLLALTLREIIKTKVVRYRAVDAYMQPFVIQSTEEGRRSMRNLVA